jgi:hypothetical protein
LQAQSLLFGHLLSDQSRQQCSRWLTTCLLELVFMLNMWCNGIWWTSISSTFLSPSICIADNFDLDSTCILVTSQIIGQLSRWLGSTSLSCVDHFESLVCVILFMRIIRRSCWLGPITFTW